MAGKNNLDNLRHSTSHLLASAIVSLWPDVKPTMGPPIEDGFYYDFDFEDVKISEADFPKIEEKMKDIVKSWDSFEKIEVSGKDAKKEFKDNKFKLELIEEFEKEGEKITLYSSGKFVDLCRGGHVERPKDEIKHFKLLSIAGSYWRGNEKNPMLTRIYGTVFPTKEELDQYLTNLEESKKRDHRKLGQELDIFTISDEIGPGLILWLPNGTIIKDELEKLGKETEEVRGYQRVSTPHIAKEEVYVTSGHLPYYKDTMYPVMESPEGNYYLKPMNCPFMHMIYKSRMHSYKELPVRFAEFGTVYRFEKSGELTGLLRVRGLTQNDAHIYCSEEEVMEELVGVIDLHKYYYGLLGLKNFWVELALPDFKTKKDKYFDDPSSWEKSIALLRKAAKEANIDYVEEEGNAAFYGPKFDFNVKSVVGRVFGASTNQLDFGSGERFGLTYVDKEGQKKTIPYIIHRAPLGSDERFIGFLIEHFAGSFPVFMAPVQVKVIPVSEKNLAYANKVEEKIKKEGIRVDVDGRNETLQAKIRDAQLYKIPYMLIVGDKEEKANNVAVRVRNGKDLGQVALEKFIKEVKERILTRSLEL